MTKLRTRVPDDIAAETLFRHDHTCCVCNEHGRPVQIHHINENPDDHAPDNLAVLCLLCHHSTQVTGGFARTFNAEDVRRYRQDWLERIAARRTTADELAIRRSAVDMPQQSSDRAWSPPPESMLMPYLNSLPRA